MIEEDQVTFDMATRCYKCNYMLDNDKVRVHCHISGKY